MSTGGRLAVFGAATVALAGLAIGAIVVVGHRQHAEPAGPIDAAAPVMANRSVPPDDWVFKRVTGPARTEVQDGAGSLLATFTDGARTAAIAGPQRTLREPKFTDATVTVNVWVRLAPQAWHAGAEREAWFTKWFSRELVDTSPDVLGVMFQYAYGAPDLVDRKGIRYAGDAQFGPFSTTDVDGRAENNDFIDYLGITYSFPDKANVRPKKDRYGDVDCSGFIRLVYGYRMGYPVRHENTAGKGLPRRAFAMSMYGPGVQVGKRFDSTDQDLSQLQPGDLVFFNLDPGDGPQADHSGIFLGTDDRGHYRFMSSRTLANGPTMGDDKFASILDGDGHFGRTFANARRL